MKYLSTVFLIMTLFLSIAGNQANAQGHVDPAFLQIQSAENPITVDGELNETDWDRRFDHLVFRSNFEPSDVEYGVTGEVEVQAPYTDTTTTIVKMLHYGLDLYISLQSNDQSVCRFNGSWEGDGLFMKINDATGTAVEYKLYFNLTGDDPDIHLEQPGLYPNSAEGAAWKHASTVVNDTMAADSGYTAELVIHLDDLGYTDPVASVPVLMNIFDPDGYTGADGEAWEVGSFHKMWWGSEWGPDMRVLRLADPPSRLAITTSETFTLDGEMNESFWNDADSVVVAKGSHLSTGGFYMQWGDTLNEYTDQSKATIKFAHNGTDLYIGVQSNDSSVCKWSPGWEADGLFLWMTYKDVIPLPSERLEVKAMYFDDTEGSSIDFQLNTNVPTGGAEGASYEPPGTVTHTETNGVDEGYSLEVVVHTDLFGYSDGDTVKLSTVMWDLDYSSADAYDADVSDYAPNWWGTQWADANFEKYYLYRDVILSDKSSIGTPSVYVESTSIDFGQVDISAAADTTITIENQGDGTLNVTDVTSDNAAFTVDKTEFNIAPGSSADLNITFTPTEVKSYSGTVTIVNNDQDVNISLAGEGVEGTVAEKPGHVDPAFLQIQSAENPITVDGELNETDWQRRFDHLVFRSNFEPSDVEYGVTGEVEVQGPYTDTTTTIVKMLHYGMDLYIALQSNDQSVCRFDGSWEGDGLFMKINDASGTTVEYKLYFNLTGDDPDINLEQPGLYPNSAEGAAWKHSATVVNDTMAADSGYTAELVIHLDDLGYTDPYASVPVLMNIFDPDGYTGADGEGWEVGSYHKMWWGSEWGPDMRVLRLADPPRKIAINTTETFTLDGELNESFWQDADSVVVAKGSHLSTGGFYMQWGNKLNQYTDQSEATIKFAHNGTDLYLGVQSNDSSVCKWSPGWEADGLFLWMTFKDVIPAPSDRLEIKAMYFDDTDEGSSINFQLNDNVPTGGAEGASYEPAGTVTHTETNGADEGYSLEVVVHTDLFGYSDGDTVKLSTVIWDMDYSSADAYDADVSDYAPHWWGTQWVDANFEKYYMYREVVLSDQTTDIGSDIAQNGLINRFQLDQNYPNPFNPTTTIKYSLAETTPVKIEIYNILGSKVSTLIDEQQKAGAHELIWNGKDELGNAVSSGIYFYKMITPKFTQTRKMMLLK